MISEISRYITGSVRVEIEGEGRKRLINAAVKQGIGFFEYSFENDKVKVSVRKNEYPKLLKINKRFACSVRSVCEKGLPFVISPYIKRVGLILGFVFGLAVSLMMSGRVWVLGSHGSLIYTQAQVLEAAEGSGIYVGAERKNIDPHKAAIELQRKLNETDFVSVNTNGVSVDIVIKDSLQKPQMYETDENKVQNVIASKDGVIRSLEASEGMPKVKLNEAVKKGDLLITGLWDTYDKWGAKTGKSFSAAARGKVIAEVRENCVFEINLKDEVWVKNNERVKKSLDFFGIRIPLNFPAIKNGTYRKEVIKEDISLLGVKMPVTLIEEKYCEMVKLPLELTFNEAEEKLEFMLLQRIKEKEKEGSVLLDKKTVIEQKGNKVLLKAECVFLEDIAEVAPVLFEEN